MISLIGGRTQVLNRRVRLRCASYCDRSVGRPNQETGGLQAAHE